MERPNPGSIARFILLSIAASLSVVLFLRTQPPPAKDSKGELSLAYYLDAAELTGTNANGELLYQVWTDRASQVPADNSVAMEKVRMMYAPNGPRAWNLAAETGRIPADASVIELKGDVVVRSGNGNSANTTIRTTQLDVDPATRQAATAAPVTVDYNGQLVYATGINADLKQNRLKLLADVNGNFVP